MYTVKELSNLLQVSKVAIYNKLKLKEMESFIVKRNSVTFVDEKGVEVLREIFNLKSTIKEVETEAEHEVAASVENSKFKYDLNLKDDGLNHGSNELVEGLKEEIETLKEVNNNLWMQLKTKDKQINELLDRIKESQELVKNGQILLKEKEQHNPVMLEKHFSEFDKKLDGLREKMESRKDESKGFLGIFKRNKN